MKWFLGDKSPQPASVPVQRGVIPAPGTFAEPVLAKHSPLDKANAPYLLPQNLDGLNQRDFLHYILRYIFKGNYLAPLSLVEGSRILDVGTGTERWALEMAQAFPSVQVYGLDLEETPRTTGYAPASQFPANYHFQAGNILKRLPFINGSFDFVHQRMVLSEIPVVQWYAVLRELKRVTRPGGWIELLESGTLVSNPGVATRQWFTLREAAARLSGLELAQVANLGAIVQKAGLSCSSYVVNLPIGPWGGPSGQLLQDTLLALYDDFLQRIQQRAGPQPELSALRAQLPGEWQTQHSELRIFLVLAENKGV